MKHFIIDIRYIAPITEIERVLIRHRAFLQEGYDAGLLLMSGPKNPREGGIIVARAESREAIEAFFARDPYAQEAVATHHFTEFSPVKRQAFLDGWVG